jgi:hypothetical protein
MQEKESAGSFVARMPQCSYMNLPELFIRPTSASPPSSTCPTSLLSYYSHLCAIIPSSLFTIYCPPSFLLPPALIKVKYLFMEHYLDAIKELNAALLQLTNTAEEWNGATSAMIRLTAPLQKLWDEICTLKRLAADIQLSLQRGAMLNVDKRDLSCINQAVVAVSCLLSEARNSIFNSPCSTPSVPNLEGLERYFKDIQDCLTHLEAILSPRVG